MTSSISRRKIKVIHDYYLKGDINKNEMARKLKISRNTVKKHLSNLKLFGIQFPNEICNLNSYITSLKSKKELPTRYYSLIKILPSVYDSIIKSKSNITCEWNTYINKFSDGYCHSQFQSHFCRWLKDNNLSIESKKCKINLKSEDDLATLKKWRLSTDRRKWEKAVVILDSLKGKTTGDIEFKIERSRSKINSWIDLYEKKGLEGLQKPRRKINKVLIQNIETKKKNLIKLIHVTPKNFEINRTSKSLKSLSIAYAQKYGVSISSTILLPNK